MLSIWPAALLGLGPAEMIVIGVVALLLFGPRVGRVAGKLGGSLLSIKRDIEGAKTGITKQLTRHIESAVTGPDDKKDGKPPAPSAQHHNANAES